MRLIQISPIVAIIIITGCSGSGANSNLADNRPYEFVIPAEDITTLENDRGGNDNTTNEEEEFIPHPLIPLEPKSAKKNWKDDALLTGGMMYDLGLQIDPINGGANNIVIDPMLESIRQDLMIKWGMDEHGASTQNGVNSSAYDLNKRISNLENSFKGDLAALRSENLLLLSKIQDLEKKIVRKPNVNTKAAIKPVSRKVTKTAAKPAPKIIKPKIRESYKIRYERALADYRKRKFNSAIKKFNVLLAESKKNDLSDNAQYWIGECYYHLKNYSKALSELGIVLKYKKSNKKDSAILMRGKALKHLGRNSEAIAQLEALVTNFPRSSYTKRARELISDMERI